MSKKFVPTPEEIAAANGIREEIANAINDYLPATIADTALSMLCHCSDETLQRRIRRKNAEQWFVDTIKTLPSGTLFTATGLVETYNVPEEFRNYATFLLSSWALDKHLIKHYDYKNKGLLASSISCSVYEVL